MSASVGTRGIAAAFPELGIGHQKSANRYVQALHETAADHVAVVANSRWNLAIGIKKEANILNTTEGQDVLRRRHVDNFAIVVLNPKILHPREIVAELYIDQVCIVEGINLSGIA